MPSSLTLVTVTYRAEDTLQRLQARSAARWAPAGLFERIIVIDNGSPNLRARQAKQLLAEYGHHAGTVEILPATEVASTDRASGWMGQQVLKLQIASTVDTPWYLLLDAKNHFVRPVSTKDFLTGDRARGGFHDYARHPLRDRLAVVLDYLDLDQSTSRWFPPTSTPFMMHTATARDVVTHVASRSSRSFSEEFVSADLSEFFLYSAWILRTHGGWHELYDGEAIQAPTLWGSMTDQASVRLALSQVEATDAPVSGVHRRALHRMDGDGSRELLRFWQERQLVRDKQEFDLLRRSFRRAYALAVLRARLRRALRRR